MKRMFRPTATWRLGPPGGGHPAGRTSENADRKPCRSQGVDTFRTQWGTNSEQDVRVREVRVGDNKAKAKKADDRGPMMMRRTRMQTSRRQWLPARSSSPEHATKFAQDYKNSGQCVKTTGTC